MITMVTLLLDIYNFDTMSREQYFSTRRKCKYC